MTKICGVGKLMNRHVPWGGSGGGGSLPPELRDALIGVWVVGKKTNDSPDRTIIKNKIPNAGGDFQLLNFAYKLNSGYGEYGADFESFDWTTDITKRTSAQATIGVNGRLCNHAAIEIGAMKVNIKGNVTDLRYWYIANPDDTARSEMQLTSGVNVLPKSYAKDDGQTYNVGFAYISGDPEITIEQIPSWQGAIRTDGVNDTIVAEKSLFEMLGDSTEFTVVSMMAQVENISSSLNYGLVNYMRNGGYFRNQNGALGKTGMFGYSSANIKTTATTPKLIDYVMGDPNDYKVNAGGSFADSFFSVTGWVNPISKAVNETSQVAWYWTFAAKKVLTGDDINQIIAAYNLDEYVNATLYYDIKKQGITNENHASFSDQLVDYSGNGRNMQLYNIAWKGNSGIGEYAADFLTWSSPNTVQKTSFEIKLPSDYKDNWVAYNPPNTAFKAMKVLISGIPAGGALQFFRTTVDGGGIKMVNGINEIPAFTNTVAAGFYIDIPLGFDWSNLVITQIPSNAGGLCLDGVNDYGQFVGNLGLKDYTVAINRAYQSLINNQVPLVSSNLTTDNTPFLMEHWNTDTNAISFSFGASKITNVPLDISKKITYQSTYSYMGDAINKGTSTSMGDGLTLGKYGAGVQYASIVLWNLLLFPYSLSPFLLERQLKKYKVGTLYPDMVEWRPKVKSDDRIKSINFYINLVGATVGNYYPIGAGLGIAVEPVVPYYVNSLKVNGKATVPNADHKGFNSTLDSKSPQNITMDIVVDGSLVQWNPSISSNAEYQVVDFYIDNLPAIVGNYYSINSNLRIAVVTKGAVDEVTSLKVNGVDFGTPSVVNNRFTFNGILDSTSPQKVDITIDEYVRFEDLVQPYPVFVGLGSITWGSKLKVGSTISFIGMSNLLSEYYSINGELLFNGVPFNRNSGQHVIEKTNTFSFSQPFTYIGDGNEPKCILYPERLSIPNGSYQILGYIPDLSGHGNNGRFNNFAFSGMSGANGYSLDFTKYVTKDVLYTDSTIEIQPGVTGQKWLLLILPNNEVKPLKLRISGIPSNEQLIWQIGSERIELFNGINEIKGYNVNANSGIYIPLYSFVGLKIEQIGEYEGAICFDGVTDFIDVPNTVGGKQMIMKVQWDDVVADAILYDQRGYPNEFAIYNTDKYNDGSDCVAYQARNSGRTFIDGILNSNIKASELKTIKHIITSTNELSSGANNKAPHIGCNSTHDNYFTNMALWCFMLFDNISTDEEITELNRRIGVEAKVSYPEYYWDAYGKTNDDATDIDGNRTVMPNKNENLAHLGLSLYNFAYNQESGYGGQGFIRKFATEPAADTWQTNKSRLDYTASDDGLSVNITKVNSQIALFWTTNPNAKSYYEITGISSSGQAIKFGTDQTGYDYSVIADKDGIYEVDWSLLVNSEGTLASACILSVQIGVRNITIKQVTQYQNGLLLDGVNDYLSNNAIPVLSDFTCIGKRLFLPSMAGSRPYVVKGDRINSGGIGNAFLMEFNGGVEQYSFGTKNQNTEAEVPALISYMTPTSYNGKAISRGTGVDTAGLFVGGTVSSAYTPMVFYKLMLYTKSLTALEINYLKNMFARDEIIDLGNPIFLEAAPPPAISIDWTSWQYVPTSATATVQPHEFNLTKVLKSGMFLQINGLTTEIPSMKVKVTGAVKESYLVYQYCIKEDDLIHVVGLNADGEYVLPASYHSEGLHWTGFKASPSSPDLDLKVEILEQY